MNPRIAELIQHLATSRAALRAAVDDIPRDSRERRPAPDRWSVAEVIEHLGIVEGRVTARLRGVTSTQAASVDAGALAEMDRAFAERVAVRNQRFKTSEASEPTGAMDADSAWRLLEQTRGELLDTLKTANESMLDTVIAPHPFFGPLTFSQWAVFVGAHDARHADQIREIRADLAANE